MEDIVSPIPIDSNEIYKCDKLDEPPQKLKQRLNNVFDGIHIEEGFYPQLQLSKHVFPVDIEKAFQDVSIVTSWVGNEITELGQAMYQCHSRIKELESQLGKLHNGNKVVVVEEEEKIHKSALHKDLIMTNN